MSTLVTLCGFCASKDQTFDVVSHELSGGASCILGIRCRKCRKVSCGTATFSRDSHSIAGVLQSDHDVSRYLAIREQVPLPQTPKAPLHVPADVAKAYVQAEKLVESPDMAEPAAVMYGRTVEIALAQASNLKGIPLTGNTLVKRIDDAAARNLLPADLAEWSHEVRQLRNDGAHVNQVDHAEVLELQGFVELLLRYLFTLPGMMADRRLKKAVSNATP